MCVDVLFQIYIYETLREGCSSFYVAWGITEFSPIFKELKEKPGSHKANRVSESNELSEISLRPP